MWNENANFPDVKNSKVPSECSFYAFLEILRVSLFVEILFGNISKHIKMTRSTGKQKYLNV